MGYGTGEMAALNAPLPQIKVLKLDGITLTLSEVPGAGGVTLEAGPPGAAIPMKLVMNSSGMELSMGANSIKLSPTGVSMMLPSRCAGSTKWSHEYRSPLCSIASPVPQVSLKTHMPEDPNPSQLRSVASKA